MSTSATSCPAEASSRAMTSRMLPCSAASFASKRAILGLPLKFICSVAVCGSGGADAEGESGAVAGALAGEALGSWFRGGVLVGGRPSVSSEMRRTSSAPSRRSIGVRFNAT
jgi:hypothetical protein